MGVLVLDAAARRRIKKAIKKARANPLPLTLVVRTGLPVEQRPGALTLDDRKKFGGVRPAGEPVMLGDYCAAISFERQPPGLCRHISISAPRVGTLPPLVTLTAIAEAFGFTNFVAGDYGECVIWREEFEPGHYAFNIVEVIEPGIVGHG